MFRKQVLKVETVDVTVDSFDFVLYLVYLYNHGPRHSGKRWVKTWELAGADLERIHRNEIRALDAYRTIELLCGPADYTCSPRAPKPCSGLVEQQRLFMKAAGRD